MKFPFYIALAGLAFVGGSVAAQAQDGTPDGAQMLQTLQARFQQQLDNASPEQKTQLLQLRNQFLAQVRQQGVDPNDQVAMAQMVQARMGGGGGAVAGGGRGGFGGAAGAGGRTRGFGGAGGGRAVLLTPEQKDAQRRQMMINAGITDKDTQDDVLDFLSVEDKTHDPLIKLARAAAAALDPRQLRIAVLSNLVDQNDQKVENAFDTYENALAVDKIRHEAALKSLDASIGYSSNPRLKAFLTLVGVTDNDVLSLGGATAIFGPAPAPPAAVAVTTPAAGNGPTQATAAANPAAPVNAAPTAPAVPANTNPFLN